jgi:hypothetical protein
MTLAYSTTLRTTKMDAITTAVGNAGLLRIYDGTQPASGGTATTKLAEFTLGSPFAPGASAGVLSPTLPADTTGLANSTATWFRVVTSGGTFVIDGTVGTSAHDLNLNTTTITTGLTISISTWTITCGNS